MIGGEFEIGWVPTEGTLVPAAYASGRAALYQILRSMGHPVRVWLPDYVCPTVPEAVERAGCTYVRYGLTKDLQACVETIHARKDDVFLLVNYFGMVDCSSQVLSLREAFPGVVLIEDDVQAYYAFAAGSRADYSFTSLRKTFPVPDGGLVKAPCEMAPAKQENSFAALKLEASQLKFRRGSGVRDQEYLDLFQKGERLIDDNYDAGMSLAGKRLWSAVDVQEVAARRKANAAHLEKGLRSMGVAPLLSPSPGQVPLFIPILTDKRDNLRRHLFAHEVYCPVHWPSADWAGRELSLIVDQRYGQKEMDEMLNLIDDIL